MSSRKPTRQQIEALTAVAAGRIKWGHAYPKVARRGHGGVVVFLIDGNSVYGGQHATFSRLEELQWIVARTDLLPTKAVPAQTRTYTTMIGVVTRELPAHTAPADDGWQAVVELTDAGRAVLEAASQRAGEQ